MIPEFTMQLNIEELEMSNLNTVNLDTVNLNTVNLENGNSEKIPNLLLNKDILSKMEEGTNGSSTNKNVEIKNPLEELEKYINLTSNSNNFDYDSEDENLLHMMNNIKIKDMPPFKKLEFKAKI